MEIVATCRPARDTRPPARRLLTPVRLHTGHPTLPWDDPPVLAEPESLDAGVRQLATSLVVAVVETLAGRRPPAQLEGWLDVEPFELLEHLCRAGVAAGARLRSLRIQCPADGAVEVAAHLRCGGSSRAAAFRLVRRDGRWLVARLETALRPDAVDRSGWASW